MSLYLPVSTTHPKLQQISLMAFAAPAQGCVQCGEVSFAQMLCLLFRQLYMKISEIDISYMHVMYLLNSQIVNNGCCLANLRV